MQKLLINSYNSLKKELDKIPLDIDENIYCLYQEDFLKLLKFYLESKIGDTELEKIADILESKDGIGFENEQIKESIHEISNFDIQGIAMGDLVNKIVSKFNLGGEK